MINKIFKAESEKLKRSFLLYMHLFVLLIFPLIMGLYYGSKKNFVNSQTMVISFYEILAIVSPLVISVVVCLVFDREEKAGSCKNWLSNPIGKGKTIMTQLLYYWLWYFVEIVGTSIFYYLILKYGFRVTGISFLKLLLTSIAFALFGFLQYAIAQLIVLKWNVGGAMILGFFGSVISALSITVIFDFIWPIVPWSWQIYLIAFWQKEMSLGSQKVIGLLMLIPLFLTVIFSLLIEKAYRNWQH